MAFGDTLSLASALSVCFSPLPSHLRTEAVHSLPHSHALTFQCSQFTITLRKLVRAHFPVLFGSVGNAVLPTSAYGCCQAVLLLLPSHLLLTVVWVSGGISCNAGLS